MFCKCGSIMMPKKDGGKVITQCVKCGYEEKGSFELKEKGTKAEEIIVVEKEVETHPVVEATCPKCGNDKAYFWTRQTRASDEPETKFFKCVKCKSVWRDYN